MDITFLPMKAAILVCCLLGAVVGGYKWRHVNAYIGGAIGAGVGVLLLVVIITIMPVKLTTNTQQHNQQQTAAAYERHSNLPPKVVVEAKTFEQLQEEEAQRSLTENQNLKEDLK